MRPGSNRAFTAIEMLAALGLMAIVAAGASLSLAGIQRRSDMAGAIDRIKFFDDLTRRQAIQSGRPLTLTFDETAINRAAMPATPGDPPIAMLQLPDGFTIDRTVVFATDQTTVPISAAGLSPTYAVLLSGRGQRRWMIVSAVGAATMADDDGVVEDEMDRLQTPR
ncbi:MAG: type II secretion system protein [Tepidisphaeraceae bacterium]|jgi:prepilin-type N-terminal cleavage/methylation domain-containing protein